MLYVQISNSNNVIEVNKRLEGEGLSNLDTTIICLSFALICGRVNKVEFKDQYNFKEIQFYLG